MTHAEALQEQDILRQISDMIADRFAKAAAQVPEIRGNGYGILHDVRDARRRASRALQELASAISLLEMTDWPDDATYKAWAKAERPELEEPADGA